MPYREIFFEKNQLFHIISRAIEEKKIFSDEINCYRFIIQLYIANIGSAARNLWKQDIVKIGQTLLEGEKIPSKFIIEEHPPLVHFLDFALVITHYHFCIVSNAENKVPFYMKKLNNSFAKYFNLKYKRKGPLFNGPYKSIPIRTELQSNAVSRYISIINPLDVYQPGWREKGLKDKKKAFEFLKNYQFSSFPDKIGERESKILASKEIREKYFPETKSKKNRNDYLQFVNDFLESKLDFFQELFLE